MKESDYIKRVRNRLERLSVMFRRRDTVVKCDEF